MVIETNRKATSDFAGKLKKGKNVFVLLFLCVVIIAGCNKTDTPSGTAATEAKASAIDLSKPVTLQMYLEIVFTDDDFNLLFADPVHKIYPNVTIERSYQSNGAKLEDLIASGKAPDIIMGYQGNFPLWEQLGLLSEDISPLLKKHNIDVGRFDPVVIDALRIPAVQKKLYGLPMDINFNALYYNKDIFDKFGLAYPKDGLLWDDAYELAKKLTRSEGGIQYRGLDVGGVSRMRLASSLQFADAETNKSLFDTAPWKGLYEYVGKVYQIPGNEMKGNARNAFTKDKNIAMLAEVNLLPLFDEAGQQGLNWDVAQYPSWKETPNKYAMVDPRTFVAVSTSKNKDAVMEVLKVMTSDDVQMAGSRKLARLTGLTNENIIKAFAADLPSFKDKHLQSIFKSKSAPYTKPPVYDGNGTKIMNDAFNSYISGKMDLNSALKDAAEKHNQAIAEQKAK